MKRSFIALLVLGTSFAAKSQCSWQDYNYITKGYMTTLQQGLDFKSGYTMSKIIDGTELQGTENKWQFSFYKFTTVNRPDSIIAVMAVSKKNGFVDRVLCIPGMKSPKDIEDRFWAETSTLQPGLRDLLIKDWTRLGMTAIAFAERTRKPQ